MRAATTSTGSVLRSTGISISVPWPVPSHNAQGVAPAANHSSKVVDAMRARVVFLIAVLPANIHAAREALTLGGAAATPLWPRVALQLLFIGLVWGSGWRRTDPTTVRKTETELGHALP